MNRRPGSGVQAWRRRNAATERSVDEAVAVVNAERAREVAEAKAFAAEMRAFEEANKPSIDEIKSARAIRTSVGWHRVVRVNGKSVTVETPYSWTDRIPFDTILEVVK